MSFDTNRQTFGVSTWTEFKNYLDGTYATLAFLWQETTTLYRIVTEEYGGVRLEVTVLKDAGADQIDFEGNFKILAPRRPGTFALSPTSTEVQLDYDTGGGTQNLSILGIALPASGGAVAGGTSSNPLRVDPTGTTAQPVTDNGGSLTVDGTVTVTQGTAANLNATIVGAGVAGTPAGGVVSIQGVSGGQVVPVSGTVTAVSASIGTNNAAIPSSSNQIGGSDGTNLQAIRVFDADTGGGTQYVLGAILRKAASGGSVEAGTSSDPLRIDPTGTTTQPVSGTITANQGTAAALSGRWPVTHTDGTNSMPTGDVAARGIFNRVTDGTNTAAVKAASTAALASDPALVVAVSPNNTIAATQSGTWTVAQGTNAALSSRWPVIVTDGTNTMPTGDVAARGVFNRVTDGTNTAAVKAASTAAAASDPALVVTFSPNSSNPLATDRSGTGTLTALNQTVAANTVGCSTVGFNVTGTWTATISIEATVDGTNWFSTSSVLYASGVGTSISGSFTANAAITINCGGYSQVRLRASAFTSGTVNVAWDSSSGTNLQGLALDELGRIITAPAGSSSDVTAGLSPGYVSTAATTRVAVRSTAYTEQTTNAQRSIVSANAADAAAGTGARTVKITYYTATFTGPFTETLTMNGTVAVNTVATNICYLEKMEVVTVGSTGSNVGIISLRTTTGGGGSTFASIAATDSETFYAHHYVATGVTCYVTGMSVGHNGTVVGSGALFIVRAQSLNTANAVDDQIGDFVRLYGQSSSITRTWGTALKVPGPARISILVTPESSSAMIYRASMDFYDQ